MYISNVYHWNHPALIHINAPAGSESGQNSPPPVPCKAKFIKSLFTQHAPLLFELFLVDLAFGEPFLEDVQGRLARRAVKSTTMP